MIPNGKGWHYLAVKKLHLHLHLKKNNLNKPQKKKNFHCLHCLYSFKKKYKLESSENIYVKIKAFVIL